MDGDNYLLYYSSIDLAGNSPSSKLENLKMKRSLSLNDSPSDNSCLRIPMKGRIQLVFSLSSITKLALTFLHMKIYTLSVRKDI